LNLEVDLIHSGDVAIIFGQIFDVDHRPAPFFVSITRDHDTSTTGAGGKFFKTAFIKKSQANVNIHAKHSWPSGRHGA
jgi:hypothetical protein